MNVVESNTPEVGFDESVARIAALESKPAKPAASKPEARDDEDEESEPEEAEESESEEESPDEVDASAEEDEDQEQPEAATLEEIEFDGHKFQIPPELKPAFLRQQDYTRKTQELAEHRKQAQAASERAQQTFTQYAQGMQLVGQVLQSLGPPQPDPALLDSDPVEYIRQERAWNAYGQRLSATQQEQQRNLQEWQRQQAEESQKRRSEMVKQLPELIPEWKDNKRAHKEFGEVCEYLKGRGFSVEELNFADDPRAFAIAREAWIGRQLIERQKAAKPVPTKTAAPGPARGQTQTPARVRDFDRAAKTGRLNDAVSALKHLF